MVSATSRSCPGKKHNDRVNTIRPYQQSTVVPDAPIGVLYVGDPGITRGIVSGR